MNNPEVGPIPEYIADDEPSSIDSNEGANDPDLTATANEMTKKAIERAVSAREDNAFKGLLGGSLMSRLSQPAFMRRLQGLIGDNADGIVLAQYREDIESSIEGRGYKIVVEKGGKKVEEDLLETYKRVIKAGEGMTESESLIMGAVEAELQKLAKRLGKKLSPVQTEGQVKIEPLQKKQNPILKLWYRITGGRKAA